MQRTKEDIVTSFRIGSIENAAIAVIARKGVDGMTVQEVAEAAGICKGTVYLYYRNRDELLSRTAVRVHAEVLADLDARLAACHTIEERLGAILAHPLAMIEEREPLTLAAIACFDRECVTQEGATSIHAAYLERVTRVVTEAQGSGDAGHDDSAALAATVVACMRGIVARKFEDRTSSSDDDLSAFIARLVLEWLSRAGTGSRRPVRSAQRSHTPRAPRSSGSLSREESALARQGQTDEKPNSGNADRG